MNIVDIIIILVILSFAFAGFRNGGIKQAVLTVGTILVFILAYYFKDIIANFLSYNLPFFDYPGPFMGLQSINIIVYQMIGFILLMALFGAVLIVLIKITSVFEKILKFTIVLSIPSKIAGFVIGLIEGYVIVFIVLFILSQPAINAKFLDNSRMMPRIVNSSPLLSNVVSKTNKSVNEIYKLVKTYNKDKDKNKFDLNSIDIMLRNKIIKVNYVDKLIDKDKINITDIDIILDNYRKD